MKSTYKILGAMTTAIIVSAAQAVPISFSFTDSGSDIASVVKSNSGVTVTVTAYSTTDGNSWDTGNITQNGSAGMGVRNGPNDDSHTIDNSGRMDYLLFSFSTAVDLTSFTMGFVDGDNDYRWAVGSPGGSLDNRLDTLFSSGSNVNPPTQGPTPITYTLSGNGTYLLLGASSSGSNDRFKVSALTINYGANTTTVPDGGSSLLLLGAALSVLGLAARRKLV